MPKYTREQVILLFHPSGFLLCRLFVNGAIWLMRAGQITGGHEKFVDDLSACEDKGLFEKFCPFFFGERVMRIEPAFEGTKLFFQFEDLLGVDDRGVDLEPVANNAGICQQAGAILLGIGSNFFDLEFIVRFAEVVCLLEDGDPRKPSLIDLKDEPLKELVVVFQREPVLGVVIVLIEGIFGMGNAIFTISCHNDILLLNHL